MKLILTKNELVQLGEVALKAHKLTGVVLQEMGETLDVSTMMKTDKQLLDEAVEDAVRDIEAVGGHVQKTVDNNYIIILPEDFTAYIWSTQKEILEVTAPFAIKAVRFIKKYKETFKRLWSYIKAMSNTFGPILERNGAKDIQKDFDALEEEYELFKNRASLVATANKALYELSK